MPASAEFAALCQSQLAMITKLIGAESAAIYLAESWSDQQMPNLLPIAIYPGGRPERATLAAEKGLPEAVKPTTALLNEATTATTPVSPAVLPEPALSPAPETDSEPASAQRLAIPMMHEGGVFGVLVGWRSDHPWRDGERDRMEECARSLTLACVLDQRGQWLKTQRSSLDQVQTQQSDRFHELLHQLRSPLTALKTFGKLLTKRLSAVDPNRSLVLNMLQEGDRLQELLGYFDDTLQAADDTREEAATTLPLLLPASDADAVPTASTVESGSLAHFGGALTAEPMPLAEVVTPLVNLTQPLVEEAGMTLQAISPAMDSWVQADVRALAEILNILIDNALKYAFPGSQIWLQWALSSPAQPHWVGLLLGDTGPGIPAVDQAHIFERHYRGLQAAGELAGTGLGLAIAADLAEEMHGQIDVISPLAKLSHPLPAIIEPDSEQQGTAFIIWLPRAEPPDAHGDTPVMAT
ncbi:MAG: GAF domain-containing sensor histidine kinase [Cyanobacteria bacterium P01_C01_bin.120]